MALEKIKSVSGRGVVLPGDDIDTDRIIPARFMKCVTFDGLGEFVFHDVKKNEDGSLKDHNLNNPAFAEASIIVSGNNFGCGSSREHAPQAIQKAGFKGIIAEGYAEIFFGNSTQLGIPCVIVSKKDREALANAIMNDPTLEITIDVDALQVRYGDQSVPCKLRAAARESLIQGKWDPIAELIQASDKVDVVASKLTYLNH